MLAAAFNAAERSGDDNTVDAAARFRTPERNGLSWRATLAQKHIPATETFQLAASSFSDSLDNASFSGVKLPAA